jgi:hypothetical protein
MELYPTWRGMTSFAFRPLCLHRKTFQLEVCTGRNFRILPGKVPGQFGPTRSELEYIVCATRPEPTPRRSPRARAEGYILVVALCLRPLASNDLGSLISAASFLATPCPCKQTVAMPSIWAVYRRHGNARCCCQWITMTVAARSTKAVRRISMFLRIDNRL